MDIDLITAFQEAVEKYETFDDVVSVSGVIAKYLNKKVKTDKYLDYNGFFMRDVKAVGIPNFELSDEQSDFFQEYFIEDSFNSLQNIAKEEFGVKFICLGRSGGYWGFDEIPDSKLENFIEIKLKSPHRKKIKEKYEDNIWYFLDVKKNHLKEQDFIIKPTQKLINFNKLWNNMINKLEKITEGDLKNVMEKNN